jgi:hypothetical protein
MKAEVTYSKLTNAAEALKYQFVIDVDGKLVAASALSQLTGTEQWLITA